MKARRILFISLLFAIVSQGAGQDSGRTHSFHFRNVELRAALDSLLRWYAVPMIYLDRDIAGKQVNAECDDCRFEDALRTVIEGQGLRWKRLDLPAGQAGEQVLLQKVQAEPEISTSTFAGTVKDSLTSEAVFGADVLLLKGSAESAAKESANIYRWCSTNQFGFFSLRNVQPGDYVLNIRRLGYRPIVESISISPGPAIVRDFVVVEHELVHPEITVEGNRSAFSASEGISRGLYIRATPADNNQYLLEGARIYNPLHFGGVMSTFNDDALEDVQVIAGGVPPYYGGRIGGILDVALRDGSQNGLAGSASLGSLGSNLLLEGPVFKGTTFLISGRRGYPDAFFPRYRSLYRNDGAPSDLNSIELMTKVTHHLTGNQQLSLTGYFGKDTYDNAITDTSVGRFSNSLRWGNAAANVRWVGVASPSLFFSASAIYTRYGFDVNHRLEGISNSLPAGQAGAPETFASDYLIEDAAVRAHAEYFYDEYHTVLAGVELVHHRMGGNISEFSSQIAPMSFGGFSPWELSVYFQDQWRLMPPVLAELGARATSFTSKQGSFSGVDPRFSLLVSLRDDLRLYSSFSAVNQFVHPYRHSGIFLFYPAIFFYPSTENIRPSTSLQVSLGMEKRFPEDRYRVVLESYYRATQNLHEFVYDTIPAAGSTRTLSDALLLGDGNVYGAEITIEKRLGTITGSLRYGFSWASNRFAELNGGEPFRPRFDRRHELFATLSYSPLETWTIEAVCLLSSNQFPSFAPRGLEAENVFATDEPGARADVGSQYAEPYDLNGGRLPGFQRLELRVLHRFSWLAARCEATLRLLNGYGLVDPFVWKLRQSSDTRLRWTATFDPFPLLPLYPVVGIGVRF
jgi:hypothetical protein